MNHNVTRSAVLCICFLSATPSYAGTWTSFFKISKIFDGQSVEGINVIPDGTPINPAGCTNNDGYAVADDGSSSYRAKSALLISAFMGQKDVQVYVDGCVLTRPSIRLVLVKAQ
jgi:hypothetical protein